MSFPLQSQISGKHISAVLSRAHRGLKISIRLFCLVGIILAALPARSYGQTSPRPVVFVHGILGDSDGWGQSADPQNLRGALIKRLNATAGYTNVNNYDLYYDGTKVLYSVTGNPLDDLLAVEDNAIPSNARFFTIRFYSRSSADPFEATLTTKVSILNKAAELSHVLDAIAQITHVQDSVLVAHSQGGLVARAYLEGLGSENPCDDISYFSPCSPGQVTYAGNVAHVVTLDTPFGGGDFSEIVTYFVVLRSKLLGGTPINVFELMPNSVVLRAINYQSASVNGVFPQSLPPTTTIDSVASYLSDLGYPCPDDGTLTCFSDDIVESRPQAIRENIEPSHRSPELTDVGNPISANDPQIVSIRGLFILQGACPPALPGSPFPAPPPETIGAPQGVLLHLISCEGHVTSTQNAIYQSVFSHAQGVTTTVKVHATLNGAPFTGPLNYTLISKGVLGVKALAGAPVPHIFVDVPLGLYTLANIDGGPSASFTISTTGFAERSPIATNRLGFDPTTGKSVTDLSISIDFTTSVNAPPTVVTSSASSQQCDSAVLNGTVNPNGAAANAYFEWGSNSLLSSFNTTIAQPLAKANAPTPLSSPLTGLTCNTTYFYRAVADNGTGLIRGSVLSFATLATLPKPALLTPTNGAAGVAMTPTFTWSTVSNATSYRLIVATGPSGLPLDPTSLACGSGCVFNVTPTSTSYAPAAGALVAGITYYWEVHARSPSQFGDWSNVSSFTTGTPTANDFSFQVTPSSQSVTPSGTAAFGISTTTTSGSAQSIALSVGNLPTGVTPIFTPSLLTSGNTAVLGLTTSSSTPAGSYSVTVVASGASSTHTATVTLVVDTASGTPAVTFSPASLSFSDQTQFTTGPSQLVNYVNTGTGPLQVLSIVGDNNFVVLNPCVNTLPSGTRCTFSVASDPSVTGPIDGKVQLFYVGATSPAVLPLHGRGLAPLPTTATIQVNGTLNGIPLPNTPTFSYGFSYVLTGASTLNGSAAETFTATPGTYTVSFAGNPSTFTLASVSPAATQSIAAGGVATFTLNFTAPNDFVGPSFGTPPGGISPQIVPFGATATYLVGLDNPPPGNASTPITLDVLGLPPGANPVFNPQPLNSGLGGTLTVTTSSTTTPPGAYTLSLSGTNSSGLIHPGINTSSLLITAAPRIPVQLISQNSSGGPANAGSSNTTNNAASADGRFVVFGSGATNLIANVTNGQVYVRDIQLQTTKLVSRANDGTPADFGASNPTISANGRFVAFVSFSDNLPLPPNSGEVGVFLRDLLLNQTEREDVTIGGQPANGSSSIEPSLSADGRFVAFQSDATNLVTGVTGRTLQVYVRDRSTGQIALASIGTDGAQSNHGAFAPSISADGRYVAFYSSGTNLVPVNTGDTVQVYVRDMESNQTLLVSAANDGSPANGLVFANANAPGISADGRFIAFTSNAVNLVPGAIDFNGDLRVFMRDLISQTTVLVDSDSSGAPLAQGGTSPTVSADGRFVTYKIYGQQLVRDMSNDQSMVVSLASDGTAGNSLTGDSTPPSISPGGTVIAFGSSATNLIANDTNGASDIFVAQNPLMGTPFVSSITLNSSSVGGGASVGGTVTISGPAPANGASIAISSNNKAAPVPALIFIPPGATSGSFSFNTSTVSKETVLTILASYNGGAAVAVLALQPAPVLEVVPSSWDFGDQPVGIGSVAKTFAISNAGTAPLPVKSIGLVSGQVFSISANTCGVTIPAGSACAVSVKFSPTMTGPSTDSLQVSYGNPVNAKLVQLFGTGAMPFVELSPATLDFGSQIVLSNTSAIVTATNAGNAPLTSISASITGPNSSDFVIMNDGCSGASLPANTSCLITLTFTPKTSGSKSATLALADNASGSPQGLSLTGSGALLTLTVTKQGTGSGTLTSSDGSINCGVTCSANFNSGAVVTLTAAPASGAIFAGWGGACSGKQTCMVTMNSAQTVSATFTQIQAGALLFVPVTPCRIADTRNPNGPFGGPFLSGETSRGFAIPNSACGIPSTAQAYSVNVTVVPHGGLGFLTTFPCGQTQPLVSTLNSIDGRVKAVAAIVPAGTNGAVCVFVTNDTELVLDIDGYYVPATDPSALAFYPVTPCRLVDTRLTAGALGSPSLLGNTTRTFPLLASPCNVPSVAQAYSLNYTSVPKGSLGFLTTWPAGQTQPLVSTLNAPTGAITANAAIVPAGTSGAVSVFVTNDSDLVIDINGFFAPPGPGGLSLFNLPPCRVLDTRNPAGTPPFSGTLNVNVAASGCGAPASAQAFVLNATVVPPVRLGFLTLWPQGAVQPLVSTLNSVDGAITSNMAIVPATNGSISAFPQDPTHLVLDISGYFATPTASPTVAMTGNTGRPAQDVPYTDLDPIPSHIQVGATSQSDSAQPGDSTVSLVGAPRPFVQSSRTHRQSEQVCSRAHSSGAASLLERRR